MTETEWIAWIKQVGFVSELLECARRKTPYLIRCIRKAKTEEEREMTMFQLKAHRDMLRLYRKALAS